MLTDAELMPGPGERLSTLAATRSASRSRGSSDDPTASFRCNSSARQSSQVSSSGDVDEPQAHLRWMKPVLLRGNDVWARGAAAV